MLGVFLLFKMNQDQIAKELCINRNKPELACDGKCYLKAQLSKQNDQQDNQEKTLEIRFNFSFFYLLESPSSLLATAHLKQAFVGFTNTLSILNNWQLPNCLWTQQLFRPPICHQ